MTFSHFRQHLLRIGMFIPFRQYLLWFILAGVMATWWVNHQLPPGQSYAGDLMILLLKSVTAVSGILLGYSLLSVLIPWLMFWYQLKKQRVSVKIENAEKSNENSPGRLITMHVHPLQKPLLGFLHFRFLYDQDNFSPKCSIIQKSESNGWFSSSQQGVYHWPLPAIRAYEVDQLLVYFEDVFQFFSFCLRVSVKQSFFTRPVESTVAPLQVHPNQTLEEKERIPELKKLEGEFLNYKNFEDNDDVRRIVWKIYARNKELVVRIPETLDPYASHINLYLSFFNSLPFQLSDEFQTRSLDFYKNACWSICNRLLKDGRQVHLFTDQPVAPRYFSDSGDQINYTLAVSQWQQNNPLLSSVPSSGSALICISGFADPHQLDQLLQRRQQKMAVIWINISAAMAPKNWMSWLHWIFVRPETEYEKAGLASLKQMMAVRKIRENESRIQQILSRYDIQVIQIP